MLDDIRSAFSFLTILPLGAPAGRKPGWSVAWFPLVGLFIGAALVAIAHFSSFDRDLSAFLILLAWVIITGGLHLDGFGDCCDGLLASVAPEERRRIMRDPRAGIWAVVGLSLLLLGKWLAIRAVPIEMLILSPVLGRWAMVWAAYYFPYVGGEGLGARFRQGLGTWQVLIACGTVTLLVTTVEIVALWLCVYCFTMLFGHWAARRLGGGISGDIYGAICELSELLCLLALAVIHG